MKRDELASACGSPTYLHSAVTPPRRESWGNFIRAVDFIREVTNLKLQLLLHNASRIAMISPERPGFIRQQTGNVVIYIAIPTFRALFLPYQFLHGIEFLPPSAFLSPFSLVTFRVIDCSMNSPVLHRPVLM